MATLEQLRRQRAAIHHLAEQYGVRNIRVFGSVARGEERRESDVDLLIDLRPGRSLLDLIGFEQELEAALGCEVDIVTEGGISPYLEARILAEALPL